MQGTRCRAVVTEVVVGWTFSPASPVAALAFGFGNFLRRACDKQLANMSTENMSPVSKDSAEKMSKKRRREEELAQSKDAKPAPETESTPAKKQKKSKKDRDAAVKKEPTEESVEVATPAKEKKKKKRKGTETQADEADAKPAASEENSDNGQVPPANVEDETSKKSRKKQKDSQNDVAETNGTEESKPIVSETAATITAIDNKQLQSSPPF